MLGMATQAGCAIRQRTVECLGVLEFSLNIGVATEAIRGHGAGFPGGCVTCGAIPTDGGVGFHPAKGNARVRLSIERARTEHRATAQQRGSNHRNNRDSASNHAKGCKTTKTTHHSSPRTQCRLQIADEISRLIA